MQECPRPEAFADDMEALFKVEARIEAPGGIDVDKVCGLVLCRTMCPLYTMVSMTAVVISYARYAI